MRKLIIFSILLFFSLTIPRTLLVPEEFMNIQQAVVAAQNEDTISVNFGRPNGRRSEVSNQRIMSKAITFEVRDDGNERLLQVIKDADIPLTTVTDSGWTEQQLVNRLDTTSDQQPSIAVDNSGRLWAVWVGLYIDSLSYDMCYSKWNETIWDEEKGIIPYIPGQAPYHLRPWLTLDNQDRAWVVYDKMYQNTDDICFTRWNGVAWEPERQVNLPDSIEYDFAPRIAFGGGQFWCCWYGNIIANRYKIYVSRWNGNAWEPETQISPQDTWHHWFCDIAVDSLGNPHVVWGALSMEPGIVYYRTCDGTRWLEPETLNNPQEIEPAGWTGTAISIDNEGNIHVTWAGIAVGQNRQDIFYSRRVNGRWLEPVRINIPDIYDEYYTDITAKEPNNIWAGWYKDIAFWESYALVSHFDGISWSQEERLDDESISYRNGTPQMVFGSEDVWAVWEGFTVAIDHMDIYYSQYLNSSINESESKRFFIQSLSVYPNPFNNNISISFTKTTQGQTLLAIYDLRGRLIQTLINQEKGIGSYIVNWDGKGINDKETPDGVYFALFKSGEKEIVKKIVKKGRSK